jgi:hypothetical protein
VAGWNAQARKSEYGFDLGAYRADAVSPKGAVVVLQEIFGVNSHIRSICDRLTSALSHGAEVPLSRLIICENYLTTLQH